MKKAIKTNKVETCQAADSQKPTDTLSNTISLACPACGRRSLYLIKGIYDHETSVTGDNPGERLLGTSRVIRECTAVVPGLSVYLNVESAESVTESRQGDSQDNAKKKVNTGPMSLNHLLDALFEPEEFCRMAGTISIPEQGEYPIATFFQNFANANDELIDTDHGFWGTITSANKIGKSLWFNTGGQGSMSIVLDEKHEEEVLHRYRISNYSDLAGARMLVFGELKKSTSSSGKLFVLITDPSRFTLRLTR